jgi:hypothetical protein
MWEGSNTKKPVRVKSPEQSDILRGIYWLAPCRCQAHGHDETHSARMAGLYSTIWNLLFVTSRTSSGSWPSHRSESFGC